MGIREYFKQHPEEEELKLSGMTIKEKPKRELWFDEEQNISDQDMRGMKKQLKLDRQNKIWGDFAYHAMRFKILFPDKILELNLNDEAMDGLKKELEQARQNKNWAIFADQATRFKILAAKEVRVTDQGLEIIKHSPADFRVEKFKRLERRSF